MEAAFSHGEGEKPFSVSRPDVNGLLDSGYMQMGGGGGSSPDVKEPFDGTIFAAIAWTDASGRTFRETIRLTSPLVP